MIKIVRAIKLTRGQITMVYEEDFAYLKLRPWCAEPGGGRFYAVAMINRKRVAMHRLILGFPDGLVDHINTDSLDNRSSNLRAADHSQNAANNDSTGVYNYRGKWIAHVTCNYKQYRAYFKTESEALAWRQRKKQELFHEFSGHEISSKRGFK